MSAQTTTEVAKKCNRRSPPELRRTIKSAFTAAALCATSIASSADHPAKEPLDTVEVRAERVNIAAAHRERALTPGAVSIVDIGELRERSVSSLADMLRYVPGVWSASDSGSDNIFFSSRGSNLDATDYDMNGIKLLQDGLPVTSADGSNHNRVVDPLSAQFAAIARGANAVKYGASTLGGAINFVSPTALDAPGVALRLSGGSYGHLLTRASLAQAFDDSFDGLLTIERKQWDGYRNHSDQRRTGVYANGGWRIGDALATRVYATYLDDEQQLPGSVSRAQLEANPVQANPDAIGGDYRLDVATWRLASKTTWRIAEDRGLEAGFSVEEQRLFHPIVDRVLVDFDGPGPAAPVEVFSLLIDTDHRDFGAMLRYNHRLEHHDLLFGLNYGRGRVEGGHFRNDGGRPNSLSARIDNRAATLEAFAMDRWRLGEPWTLVLAAQVVSGEREARSTDVETGVTTDPEDHYASINPSLGVILDPGDGIELFANLSRLFEPPTTYELQDDVLGGGEALAPMQGLVLEVGSRGERNLGGGSRWMWDAAVYYARIQDEILSVDDPAAPGTSLSTNVDETVHAGLEALSAFSFALDDAGTHRVEPLLSLTLNHFRFVDHPLYGDNRLPAAPLYVLLGELIYRHHGGFHVGPTFEFVGERYADFSNGYEVDAHALLGLRGGWSSGDWSVFAEVGNLRDEDYVATHSVRDIAGADAEILNPGRPLSVYVGVHFQLE